LEACDRLYDGSLPSRPAVITFDDGYRDNYTVALPILQRRGMKAAFFVATGFLNGGMMFNDRVIEAVRRASADTVPLPGGGSRDATALPVRDAAERRAAIEAILNAIKHLPPEERLERVEELERETSPASASAELPGDPMMMNPDQVAGLHRAGMTVGGHTRKHPILLKLPDAEAQAEISGGLDDLAAIVGARPRIFAYPNGKPGGDFDARHVAMVGNAGCDYAFTTRAGAADRQASRLELPRFTPWDRSSLKFGLRAWRNLAAPVAR
jgi:peptidoglycan/xylan/chitin deacetylase (PgdA/CDA1 family)